MSIGSNQDAPGVAIGGSSAPQGSGITVVSSNGWVFPTREMQPQPVEILHFTGERAFMLATLPRKKWDEFTWGALSGTLAALPSAADALLDAFNSHPFSLQLFPTVQVVIFVGFAIWFVITRVYAKQEKTSIEYLNEIRNAPHTSVESTRV